MQSKKDGEDLKERHGSFHRPLFREEVFERCLQECGEKKQINMCSYAGNANVVT